MLSAKLRLLLQIFGVFLMFYATQVYIDPETYGFGIPAGYVPVVVVILILAGIFFILKFRRVKESND